MLSRLTWLPAFDTTDHSASWCPPTSSAILLHLLCPCLLLGSTSRHGGPHAQSLQFSSSPRGLIHTQCFNRLKVTQWVSPALNFAELQTCRCTATDATSLGHVRSFALSNLDFVTPLLHPDPPQTLFLSVSRISDPA